MIKLKLHEKRGAKNVCNLPNPMKTDTRRRAVFGLAITQSGRYQKTVGCAKAKCEFNRVARILKRDYDISVRTPFSCKVGRK